MHTNRLRIEYQRGYCAAYTYALLLKIGVTTQAYLIEA